MLDIKEIYEIFKTCPRITIDSRHCPKDSIFVALRGDNTDGNLFAAKALENGSRYAIVDRKEIAVDDRYIVVDDTLTTLQDLARYHRTQIKAKIIAITGTNGKTTTKELIAQVLSQKYDTLYTEKNYNNHIGVPLTLLRLEESHRFGVVEMGANHKGEIAQLCSIVQPDFGLVTNFGRAHIEGFGSFEGVVEAKTELFDYIREHKGRVFVNIGNELMVRQSQGIGNISYAINSDKADVSGYVSQQDPCITISWASQRFSVTAQTVKTNIVGGYNAENLLAAIVVGLFFEVDPQSIDIALSQYIPKNHRSQYMKTDRNELIVDAYNANPSSMEAAIRNFASLQYPHKTLILGDMLELGENTLADHTNIMKIVEEQGFDKVILVGKIFAKTQSGYTAFDNVDGLIEYLTSAPISGSAILLKGSNSIGLERLIEYL